MKKVVALLLAAVLCLSLASTAFAAKEIIVIYSCANDARIALMQEELSKKFPDYEFIVEYMGTSKLAAKLMAEGKNTDCDIVHDLNYLNLHQLEKQGYLADVSWVDTTPFVDDVNVSNYYTIECRPSGSVIINTEVMAARGLEKPTSYDDLLKPEYKGLISMPDPKASSTGYMFLKGLAAAWGDEKAMDYFHKLSENVLQFTSSGNGPVNSLALQEVAIGLGMTNNAVDQIENGLPLEILFMEEGAPVTIYGQTIMAGKDQRESVKEVFKWMVEEYLIYEAELRGTEKIYKDHDFTTEAYPSDKIVYSDMGVNTVEEKERLLALWDIT